MEDHDYARVMIGEFPDVDTTPARQYPGLTDPSHPPHLLTPVLQTIATGPQVCAQATDKDSASVGESDRFATLLQQQLSVAQLLQIAQQHKLLLFNQARPDQTDSQADTTKLKESNQTNTSNSTSSTPVPSPSHMPMALFAQPPAGIPLSHLIPIPANMAQQLIASGSVKLQGPSGPVTVQTLIAPPAQKMDKEEKRELKDGEKETEADDEKETEANEKKLDKGKVLDQTDGNDHDWKPVSTGRASRNTYRIPKKSSANECKEPSDDKALPKLCYCRGCTQPAKPNEERGPDFCSNECVVKHCKMVFRGWVAQQSLKAT